MQEEIHKLIGLPPPPLEIFEFQLPQGNTQDPEQRGVKGQGGWYFPDHAEYIPGVGGVEYFKAYGGTQTPALPAFRVPFWDTINLLNPLKRDIAMAMRLAGSKEARMILVFSFFMGKKWRGRLLNKLCEAFNEKALGQIQWKYLKDEFYSPPVREIIDFTERFLVLLGVMRYNAYRTARTIGMMFENDQAYCWRFEDAMTEATEKLKTNPYQEMKRLSEILIERDPNPEGMAHKYQSILKALRFAPIKKELKKALEPLNIENCKLTENDIYHTLMYGSYNIQGKSPEERLKIYETYHGTDKTQWPARWSMN